MSKKTRKKSLKSPTSKTTRGASRTKPKGSPSKSRKPLASKTSKNAKIGQAGNSVLEGSHGASSKPLKSRGVRRTAEPVPGRAGRPKAAASAIAEGASAPSLRLPRDGGSTVSLSNYAGNKLVVFFYPRADTPGCTREAIDFTRLSRAFSGGNTKHGGIQ
jgi:thioredoxin-dependent peroxiredoxin